MGGWSIAVLKVAVSCWGGGREGRCAPASSGRNKGAGGPAGYTAGKKANAPRQARFQKLVSSL